MAIPRVLKPLLSILGFMFLSIGASTAASAQAVQADGVPPQVVTFTNGRPNIAKSFCLEQHVHGAASADHRFGAGVGKVRVTFVNGHVEDMAISAALASPAAGSDAVMSIHGVTTWTIFASGGDPSGIVITPRADVKQVEFLTSSVVFTNDVRLSAEQQNVVAERVGTALGGVDLQNKSYGENQRIVWDKPFGLLEEPLRDGRRVVRTVTQDYGKFLSIRIGRLEQQADCSLVRTPNGAYLLHDLGGNEEEIRKVVAGIPVVDGQRRIKIVITHPDLDHYRGLTWLLKQGIKADGGAAPVVVDEVLIGTPASKAKNAKLDEDYSGRFKDVVSLLNDHFTLQEAPGGFTRYVRNDNLSPLELAMGYTHDLGEPNILSLPIDPECSIQIMSPGDPDLIGTARHAHNLIVSYEHRGFTFLDAGDADPLQLFEFISSDSKDTWADAESDAREIAEYVRSYEDNVRSLDAQIAKLRQKENKTVVESAILELREQQRAKIPTKEQLTKALDAANTKATAAKKLIYEAENWRPTLQDLHVDVLKWPHHAWRPTSKRQVEIMKAFLKAYRPREVLVCVPRNMTKAIEQRLQDIDRIIGAVKKEEADAGRLLNIKLRVTNEEGCDTLEFRAEAEQLKAVLKKAGLWSASEVS